jgi:hypothetical protein
MIHEERHVTCHALPLVPHVAKRRPIRVSTLVRAPDRNPACVCMVEEPSSQRRERSNGLPPYPSISEPSLPLARPSEANLGGRKVIAWEKLGRAVVNANSRHTFASLKPGPI